MQAKKKWKETKKAKKEDDPASVRTHTQATNDLKVARRDKKRAKKCWQWEWVENVVEEADRCHKIGDSRGLYEAHKKLGI